jgi:outer membrane protein OmpA-like peptidoglycan-associated protein
VGAVGTPVGPATPADRYESDWVGWNSGGKDASFGFAIVPHIGFGQRLNDASAPGAGPTSLLLGASGLLRINRYFGLGAGYEHAGFKSVREDSGAQFKGLARELDTVWIQARVYPLRVDPFALYLAFAAGPTWESLKSNYTVVDKLGQTVSNRCSGQADANAGLRGALGGELALSSGFMFFTEIGPTGYLLGTKGIGECGLAQGNAINFDLRAGLAFGMEKTRKKIDWPDTDKDQIVDAIDACPQEPGTANADPAKHGCPLRDKDGDGVLDEVDACRETAGLRTNVASTNGCPDKDGDGVFDLTDVCPSLPGIATDDASTNGCPDKDGDSVPDPIDACPELSGIKSADPKAHGCPPDTDSDGIRDDKDACPKEAGPSDPDPKKHGCPTVVVREGEIVINEQVQFDTGAATIKPVSNALLDNVAKVIKDHPELLGIEVQGHTDNKGSAYLNTKLSKDRASSVMKALVKRGVDATRLSSQGFGSTQPIADNATEEGRQTNRRVAFKILKKQ